MDGRAEEEEDEEADAPCGAAAGREYRNT
jgi:hypothetical protein